MSGAHADANIAGWDGATSPLRASYGKLFMWFFLISDALTFSGFLCSYGFFRHRFAGEWPVPSEVFHHFPFMHGVHLPLMYVGLMTFILIMSSVTMVLAVHEGHRGNRAGVVKWMLWTICGGLAFLLCQAWEWHHLITGAHPVFADGKIELIGQTMGGNPWGHLVDPAAAQQALSASSHETLVHLAHEYPMEGKEALKDALEKMDNSQLAGMIDLTHAHIRERGPIAFGGYFFGITGFHGFHVFSGVVINVIMTIMAIKGVFDRKGHYMMIEKAGLYWHFVDLVWVFVFTFFYLV